MKLIRQQKGGENRIALLNEDDELEQLYIQRDSMLNLGECVNGIIRKKNTQIQGYFVETDKKGLFVFVRSSESYPEGHHVVVKITKEARRGKEANGVFTDSPPADADDIAELISEKLTLPIQEDWDKYELDDKISELLEPVVPFHNSATLTIERTLVCYTIDIDTKKETINFADLNTIAIPFCVKQIKLRNMVGLIYIDFAGPKPKPEVHRLIRLLKEEFAGDVRTKILGGTPMGLIEIRRTRTFAALADLMTTPDGRLNAQTIAYNIIRGVSKAKTACPIVRANPQVISLIQEKVAYTAKCEADPNCPIDFFEIKEKQ